MGLECKTVFSGTALVKSEIKPDIPLVSTSRVLLNNPFCRSVAYAGKLWSQGNIQIQSPGG